jgi:hypothetical protein
MRAKAVSVVVVLVFITSFLTILSVKRTAHAHCDTMGGPVIADARKALETGDVTPVLKWVKPENEGVIREAFRKAMIVRKKGDEARELADMYFFETVVRLHRESEGEPYTGLKPEEAVEPIVKLADKAIISGSAEELISMLNKEIAEGVEKRLSSVLEKKKHVNESVEAGRKYVEAYVEFVHYVEQIHVSATAVMAPHHPTGEGSHPVLHH